MTLTVGVAGIALPRSITQRPRVSTPELTTSTATAAATRHGARAVTLALAVALVVAGIQWWFVARTASGMPIDDQWDLEGARIYPSWIDGTWRGADLLAAHNEHRIVWTHLLNLLLFAVNGQWDPLVQLLAIAGLRAAVAGWLAWTLIVEREARPRVLLGVSVVALFLPHLSWQNVQWGFQSQVYFSLGFALVALWLLGYGPLTRRRWLAGTSAGIAAQLGMSSGAFVAVALLALLGLQVLSDRSFSRERAARAGAAALLLGLALALRVRVPEHDALRATSLGQFVEVFGRSLAWPYPGNAWVALALNLPFAASILRRSHSGRSFSAREDYSLLLGFFGLAAAGAQAALRGGGDEFIFGVPSRYADFLVPLVAANGVCLVDALSRVSARHRRVVWVGAAAWGVLLFSGWLASSAQVWRGVAKHQLRHRDLPAEGVRRFQLTRDPAVSEKYPRLFSPHRSAESIRRVIDEPRLQGRLPPALQPEHRAGPLSRLARWLRDQAAFVAAACGLAALALVVMSGRNRALTAGIATRPGIPHPERDHG